ncbi:hypothetical protein TNCV_3270921 [Trichonephila clavipes]|nr:hypothetical protein TNCV_3270921 [Trichonephila clavipes]
MVQNRAVDEAVFNVTEAIRNAADAAIPKTSNIPSKAVQTMVERFLPTSQKEQRRAWGIFRRYPTTDNLIAFKRAKALARRIRRQCQRILDPVCVFNHIVNYQSTVMEKGQSSEWPLSGF